jgi:predicted permease
MMKWFNIFTARIRALFRRESILQDIEEEQRIHIEMATEENLRRGMLSKEARAAALKSFGNPGRNTEIGYDVRGGGWLEDFWQDLRFGARMLVKQPGFTSMVVLTLALGIGANTAIFSLLNAVLLRQLPFPDSHQLTVVWADNPGKPGQTLLPPANADVAAWRKQSQSFAKIAAFSPRSADLVDGGDPERLGAAGVTAEFFETLGVTPVLGRPLAPEEEAPGSPPVVLISYGLWQRRFGGEPGLIGKEISLNGERRTVIGILPPEFDFPRSAEWSVFFSFAGRTEIWLPLSFREQDDGTGWSNWQSLNERSLAVIGRLKSEVSLPQAQAEMDAFAANEASVHPATHKDLSMKLISLHEQLAGKSRQAVLILFAAASLLLLIACVNVANLLLARGVARQQELAVRAALGAVRGRLMRQLFTEYFLLALLGCALGLLVAEGCLKAFLALNPLTYSRLNEASLSPIVLGFTALTVIVTNVVFGLIPAFQASRIDLQRSLQEGGRSPGHVVRERVRGWLVGAEVALALVLLTMASLMVRSFLSVQAVQPGFQSDSVLTFELQPPKTQSADSAREINFYQQLSEHLETLPGVRSAGAISYLPLNGGQNTGSFVIEDDPPVNPGSEPTAERRWVTPGYFAAMGILIKQGRVFTPGDTSDQPNVIIINETIARQFFSTRNPVGRRLKVLGALRVIVGVVSDVKSVSLESNVGPQIYLPHAQDPWPPMTMVVRTEGEPLALASAVRAELKALGAFAPAAKMQTLEQVLISATSARRFNMALLAFFAVAALFLTIVGIYGVVAFLTGQQSREIGIRIALGAQPRDVLRLVLLQGMKPVVFGSVVGLAGSLSVAPLVASQFYGVSPSDPLTLISIIVLLVIAALLACWVPARRATKVDPMIALRSE